MAAEDLLIIAIELASSSVTGVAGRKLPDGSLQIEAVVEEPSATFIRKGMIYNMDKSTQCVKSIIERLQKQLKRTITQVYVGFGGQSIHSMLNSVTTRFDGQLAISKDSVDDLMKQNLNTKVGDRDILDVKPQEYGVGTQKQIDPVGVLSDHIEGRYLNIVARSSLRTNIDNCFAKVGIHVVEDKLIPLTIADEVLSDTEKRSGCVLVDFGADTTTVSIYKANLLRFVSVIPLGSSNVTKDIMSCQLDEKEAEELKLTYGEVETTLSDEDAKTVIFTLPDGTTIDKAKLNRIIQARMEEILTNVMDQIITSGYGSDLLVAGAWLVGGGSSLRNLPALFTRMTTIDKVKVVKTSLTTVHLAKGISKNTESHLLGVISLLGNGTQTCTSALIPEKQTNGIFGENPNAEGLTVDPEPPVVPKSEPDEQEKTPEAHSEPKKPKGPSIFKRFGTSMRRISEKIVGEE